MKRLIETSRLPMKHILLYGFLPSPVKRLAYRLKGYRIDKDVRFGFGSVVVGDDVEIASGVRIGFFTIIRARRIRLGRFVRIGSTSVIDTESLEIDEDAKINEQVFIGGLRTPESSIKIGKRAIVMQLSFLNPTMPIEIGDDSGIGGHCLLFTHGSWLSQLDGFPVTFAPIKIGQRVWLPWRVFIMPGVTIGNDVVIGANSLVNRDLPSRCLAAGSPAKVLKTDFPPPVEPEERERIVAQVFDAFAAHLKHFGHTVLRTDQAEGFTFDVRDRVTSHRLMYRTGQPESKGRHAGVEVLVLDDPLQVAEDEASSADLVVDLRRKSRRGTSRLGEEFVSFVSRYGIRFERLD